MGSRRDGRRHGEKVRFMRNVASLAASQQPFICVILALLYLLFSTETRESVIQRRSAASAGVSRIHVQHVNAL